ncbi:NADH dehydrogenase [ubiquinone] 1 beta subcomplex subunit 9 [Folsomia candida]|uniref:NADH dehydrogenase [ubiquinone] 1 beta subcomplex subunit 9 n=1 Tax=Folsomia candida TaxID=158441 RepID=A0A226DQD4_FOLCA|nr:NADH dehydrogenase [ubiquinone] 1 beta subcomplex subunit 9 [Folsomia candida]OXA47054.1 NADH dehydrogenase [ubiquinone] 1 beta subcomplex subunit 9 [Folsomia candida]
MSYLQTELISHTRKVCSLYKQALRNIEAHCMHRHHFRYNAVLMRQRFEENRNILDMRKAKELIALGQEELFLSQHYQPLKFPKSPGGVAYDRETTPADWTLDYWHPLEKAQYPEYFARREQRKKEYVEMWEKQYGKPDPSESHH